MKTGVSRGIFRPMAAGAFLLAAFLPAAWASTAGDCASTFKNGDHARAVSPCTIAASQGDRQSQYTLGRIYEKGKGVPRDLDAAVKWYRHAAEAGHPDSQYRLAVAYAYGLGGLMKDDARAAQWLERAARGGNRRAQKQLAQAYEQGLFGLPRDQKLAQHWHARAQNKDRH
jgi:TPR repeat protein